MGSARSSASWRLPSPSESLDYCGDECEPASGLHPRLTDAAQGLSGQRARILGQGSPTKTGVAASLLAMPP